MAVSLKNIADKVGVSTMSVSMALRDDPSISEKRREEIKAVAASLGYRPNIIAKSLRGGKTHSIGVLWSLGGPHDSIDLVRSISLKLMGLNYVTYIADSLGDPEIISSGLLDFTARNIDGLIIQLKTKYEIEALLTPIHRESLKEIGNVVIVNEIGIDLPDELHFDEIKRPRQNAFEEIINFFAKSGRKKIALISPELSPWREQHFIDCLKAHKLDQKHCRLITPTNLSTIPIETFTELDKGPIEFDAIMTHNDESAVQLINYLKNRNLKVPDDVAVTGFNNSFFSQFFTPPIASIERRVKEIGEVSVDLLMNRIKDKKLARQQKELPMFFVKRESAG